MTLEEAILECKEFDINNIPNYMNLITELSNDNFKETFSLLKEYDLKKYNLENFYSVNEKVKYLWILIGSYCIKNNNNNQKWIVLEVGSSLDIVNEIRDDIHNMTKKPGKIAKGSTFFPNAKLYTQPTYSTKDCCKYRMIKNNFTQLKWYQISPIDYIKSLSENTTPNTLMYSGKPIDIINFVESHIAFVNKALLWNPAPQTNGNQETWLLRIYNDNYYKSLKIKDNELCFIS